MRFAFCLLLAVAALAHCVASEDKPEDRDEEAVDKTTEDLVDDEWREGRAAKRRSPGGGNGNATRTTPATTTTVGKRTPSTKRVGTTPASVKRVTSAGNSTTTTTTTTSKGKKKASLVTAAKTTPTPGAGETPKLYVHPARRPRPELVADKATAKPAVTKPAVTKPAVTKPAVSKPAVSKPGVGGPRLPDGATAAGLSKPTKYHYYPHNQHIYLLPECAIQQVCNAVYVRLNFTQPLCACSTRYQEPCSASLRADDLHTTPLVTDPRGKALTLVKTCEPVAEMRRCKAPRDWALLALQNVRTGKSHYLVLCRCQDDNTLEGPMNHDQPSYASVPGIRVYGMMCVQAQARRQARPLRTRRHLASRRTPPVPWASVHKTIAALGWDP